MKDKLSALFDGNLEEHAVGAALDGLRRDDELRKEWGCYCLIGDVLRGDREGSPDFVNRVMSALDDEPVVLAPRVAPTPARRPLRQVLMPIAASVMGVAAVGWVAAALYGGEGDGTKPVTVERLTVAATVPPTVAARVPVAAETADPHREYLFAHQAMTSGGPIPGAVQYVRTVSEVEQERGR